MYDIDGFTSVEDYEESGQANSDDYVTTLYRNMAEQGEGITPEFHDLAMAASSRLNQYWNVIYPNYRTNVNESDGRVEGEHIWTGEANIETFPDGGIGIKVEVPDFGIGEKLAQASKDVKSFINNFQFGSYPTMAQSDIAEGYRYGLLLEGTTNVRIRYGEDGELEVHPDDMQMARETNEENAKGMILSAVAPGLLNGVFKGIKGLNNVIPQELSKATTVLADEVKVLAESPWSKGPITRGNIIDNALGNNLGRTFPTVDKLENGILTSTKSLDVIAPTYQNEVAMFGRMKADIDALKGFQSGMRNGVFVSASDFTKKVFELALPEAQLTAQQLNAINMAKQYAIDAGVEFRIVVVK